MSATRAAVHAVDIMTPEQIAALGRTTRRARRCTCGWRYYLFVPPGGRDDDHVSVRCLACGEIMFVVERKAWATVGRPVSMPVVVPA